MNFLDRARAALAELIEKRDSKTNELDQFAALLDTEKRNATEDEDALTVLALDELRSLNEEISKAQADVDELEKVDAARSATPSAVKREHKRTADDPYDIEIRSAPRTAEVRKEIEDRAKRALEQDRSLTDEQRSAIDDMLRDRSINKDGALARHLIVTGRPAYRSVFAKLMRSTTGAHLTEAEAAALDEVRAINITTDANGGLLMPYTLDPTINVVNDGVVNPMRQLATVRTVATDNWHGVSTAGVTASWDNEAEEVSDDTPTLTSSEIKVRGIKAFVPLTFESIDDLSGISDDVTALIREAIDDLEASGFATGAGTDASKQPQGLITGLLANAGSIVQTAAVATYALADLDALSDAVPDRYDARAQFLMHRKVLTATRGLAESAGDPVRNLASSGPLTVRSRSVRKYSALDSTIATGSEIVVCGDIASAYRIHDRIGVTVELVPHLFGANGRPTGTRGIFARKRVGAGVVNANAARVLQVK